MSSRPESPKNMAVAPVNEEEAPLSVLPPTVDAPALDAAPVETSAEDASVSEQEGGDGSGSSDEEDEPENPERNEEDEPENEEEDEPEHEGTHKRVRKPRTKNKLPTETYVITRVDQERGYPASPEKWAKKFNNVCGALVKEHVPISTRDWGSYNAEEKDTVLNQLLKIFRVPPQDEQLVRRAGSLTMANSLKNWRYMANKLYVQVDERPDFETVVKKRWEKIEQEQWDRFVAEHTTAEFLETSRRNKALRAKNVHPHSLGSRGYLKKIPDWEKEDAKRRAEGKAVPFEDIAEQRGRHWLLARAKKDAATGDLVLTPELEGVHEKLVTSDTQFTYLLVAPIFRCRELSNSHRLFTAPV